MQEQELEFTGERFMPSISGNIFLEHAHRYHVAARFAKGKDVLDIASGEGYGSALLAATARKVVGVDISEAAVKHAQKFYGCEKLEYRVGSCTDIPLPDHSVDLVVSFETLEHIDAHEQMLLEIKRVLRPGGCLIISTPEKAAYTDATGLTNPFHVKELYRDEFSDLISRHFRHATMHCQRIGFGSIIACEVGAAPVFETDSKSGSTVTGLIAPLYLIAIASDDAMAVAGDTSVFSQDIQASEPVLKRVEFEHVEWEKQHRQALETARAGWEELQRQALEGARTEWEEQHWRSLEGERARREKQIEGWSQKVAALQQGNWLNHASSAKILRRMIVSRLLYLISGLGLFSERQRKKFATSAQKRDPLVVVRNAGDFCATLTESEKARPERADKSGIVRSRLKVTAIVPNYNHARFLQQRLDSILAQSYPVSEIVVLDDASTDDSRRLIESYCARFPSLIRTIFSSTRSGNVFDQWKKGHEAAKGDLVWICESDDFCETDFVEKLIPLFFDPSVMLAFGRIQAADEAGNVKLWLDHYRDSAEAGIWNKRTIRPAHEWFAGTFGVKNVIANVGGSLWRRFPISDEVWKTAKTFKIMGDWYMYSVLPRGGQIGYEPGAVSYFRIHDANTSVEAQKHPSYYEEYARLMAALCDRWEIPQATLIRFFESCRAVYLAASPVNCSFDQLLNLRDMCAIPTKKIHVLMGILGFSFGGGELFPINLANALHRRGVMVSMFQYTDDTDNPAVRRQLDKGIPVYTAKLFREMGIKNFAERAGISIIHSHFAAVETVMLEEGDVSTPFIATLHGSYEAMNIPSEKIRKWAEKVNMFVYTAERNLEPFRTIDVPQVKFCKFRNAMPVDDLPFPVSRSEMGIPDDAVVFTLVARGIEEKGWTEAVRSFVQLERRRPDQDIFLLMVGEGEETEKARTLAAGNPRIRFLGFQERIHGLYRISDVALAPTRFSGESYPLCLIQSMQVGTPVVATDVGEIKSMLELNGKRAGIVVPYNSDTDDFVAEVSSSMEAILDAGARHAFSQVARSIGETFDIDALCEKYLQLYTTTIQGQEENRERI